MKTIAGSTFFVFIIIQLFAQETGTFEDPRDNKIYKTVKIGNQTWFAENLAYKVDSGCWAYENRKSYVPKFGYLYTWDVAMKSCPVGWHLPTKEEWNILIDTLGGQNVAGGKLKSASKMNMFTRLMQRIVNIFDKNKKLTNDWLTPNVEATNSSGFNSVPGGYRYYTNGSFSRISMSAYYWWATPMDSMSAWSHYDAYYFGELEEEVNNKLIGFSVRCIKD